MFPQFLDLCNMLYLITTRKSETIYNPVKLIILVHTNTGQNNAHRPHINWACHTYRSIFVEEKGAWVQIWGSGDSPIACWERLMLANCWSIFYGEPSVAPAPTMTLTQKMVRTFMGVWYMWEAAQRVRWHADSIQKQYLHPYEMLQKVISPLDELHVVQSMHL